MLRRAPWLVALAVLLVLAGGGTGRLHAAVRHHAAPCATMVMAADHAPAQAHKDGAGRCGTCGIDCPMHCAAVGTLAACVLVPPTRRPAYPPGGRPYAAGWPPGAEHEPPKPLA